MALQRPVIWLSGGFHDPVAAGDTIDPQYLPATTIPFPTSGLPLADGVGDTRAGSLGVSTLPARSDHVHPIARIATIPAFGDLLVTGNVVSSTATAVSASSSTEDTIVYRGQKTITGNTGMWLIVNPPVIAGYTLVSFQCSPYSANGMAVASSAQAGGDSRNFDWQYGTYYDNLYRNNLVFVLSFMAVYRLN